MNFFLLLVGSFFFGWGSNWKIGLGVFVLFFILIRIGVVLTENQVSLSKINR